MLEARERYKDLKVGDKIVKWEIISPTIGYIISGESDAQQPFYGEIMKVEGDNITAKFDGHDSPETISILKINKKITDKEYITALDEREEWIKKASQ